MYSTFFLCVKGKKSITCREFQSFLEADEMINNTMVNNTMVNNTVVNIYDTIANPIIVPICKFMPQIIRRQILQFKLASIYNRVSII
jgi:hypothetical protein